MTEDDRKREFLFVVHGGIYFAETLHHNRTLSPINFMKQNML